MSQFVNPDGRLKSYAVVDERARTVVGTFNWVGETVKAMTELQKRSPVPLSMHNLTHAQCPDWLKEEVRSDAAYCGKRAQDFEAHAAALRLKASAAVAEAERYEEQAAAWRELAEAPGAAPAV